MASLEGPRGPIHYERDELGYPSIRARDLNEGMYALGYFHATDRLTQVALMTLASRGELMSVLGDTPFARLIDRSMRLLGPLSPLGEAVPIDPATRDLFTVYSAGFNRAVRERGWPNLLRVLGVSSFEYTPERMAQLFRFVTYFGLTSTQLSAELIVAELCARGAPRRIVDRLLGDTARGLSLEDVQKLEIPDELTYFNSPVGGSPLVGSNAFAVASERSASGGALLVGEFHMEVGRFPPILYACHLELPDGEFLSGMTIPGMAWLAAGRTRHVGWSYTFAHADNVDILVEQVRDGTYRVGEEFRPFRKRTEQVTVRRRPAETWDFYENDYGTLIGDANGEGYRACVRVSGADQVHRALMASRKILECRTVDDMVELHREVRGISLEAVVADSAGSIASVVTGQIDRRPDGWTGAYPRRGWDLTNRVPDPLGEEFRPISVRPEIGVLASANQGGQEPHRGRWCTLPEPIYRFERLTALLNARKVHDVHSLLEISYDSYDGCAARMLRVWGPRLPEHPLSHALREWAKDPRGGKYLGLFHKLHEEVYFALLAQDIGSFARHMTDWAALTLYQYHVDQVLALERPDLLDAAELEKLLAEAFPKAVAGYETYDVPVKLRFRHIATQGRSPAWLGFDSSQVELPGSPTSLFQSRVCWVAGERLVYAPAFHLVIDMSRRGVWYNLPGGASEARFGPGYGLGLEAWLAGDLLPLGAPEGDRPSRAGNAG